MRKTLTLLLVLLALTAAAIGGCGWMGRTAGKAQARIERGSERLEAGYEQGYKEEKAKDAKVGESGSGGSGQ